MREIKIEESFSCSCGRIHRAPLKKAVTGEGAIEYVISAVNDYKAKKVFVIADKNTYKAAGEKVCALLRKNNVEYFLYVFSEERVIPDDCSVGKAVMAFDRSSEMIIAVGSGVINDIGKIIASTAKLPYAIVATAPSMDGYASATSSMEIEGLKVSVKSKMPEIIIGDTKVLKNAPLKSFAAGFGDMIAKYISIADWRISGIVNGEFYCEEIAESVRGAVKKCAENAEGLLKRNGAAAEAVFEGLLISGAAMSYADCSRPASGAEHYISHIYDMRGLAFGSPVDSHGTQCGIATHAVCKVYDKLKKLVPDKSVAMKRAKEFDRYAWYDKLRRYIGKAAEKMIETDERDRKYDLALHSKRLDKIIDSWDEIVDVIRKEVPSASEVEALLRSVGAPVYPEEIGLSSNDLPFVFAATKDIRDKYVLSNLCWDLGIIDESFS